MYRLPSLLKTRDGLLVGRVPTFWAVKPNYTATLGPARAYIWDMRQYVLFNQDWKRYESALLCNPSSNLSPPSSSSIQTPSSTPASLAPAEFLPVTTTTSQVPHLWQQISKAFHLLCLSFSRCNILVCFWWWFQLDERPIAEDRGSQQELQKLICAEQH